MKKKSEVILDKIEIRLAQIIFSKRNDELIHQFERSIARSVMNDRKITEDIQDEFLGEIKPEEPPTTHKRS